VPLVQRREVLQRIVERKPHANVRFSEVFDVPPQQMLAIGLPPRAGRRDRQAARLGLRVPPLQRLDQAQVQAAAGVRDRRLDRPEGLAHRHRLAAAGRARDDGKLRYAGNVGTGFNEQTLRELRKRSTRWPPTQPVRGGHRHPARAHWVRPELVCEVSFGEWTRDGKVRHSVFHGLRTTSRPKRIGREEPVLHAPPADKARPSRARPRRRRAASEPAPARRPQREARGAAPPCRRRCASATPTAWSIRRAAPPRSSWCATTRWSRR
jgi:bifunctional non-homologous end joining protein LigD